MSIESTSKSPCFSPSPLFSIDKNNSATSLYNGKLSLSMHKYKSNSPPMLLKEKLLCIQRPAIKLKTLSLKKVSQEKKIMMQNSSVIEIDSKKKVLKKNKEIGFFESMKNEQDLGKRFEIVWNIIDKYLNDAPDFKANKDFIKEFFEEIKKGLSNQANLATELRKITAKYLKLQESFTHISKTLSETTNYTKKLQIKISHLKEENVAFKLKNAKSWEFFETFKSMGIPIDKLYKNFAYNKRKAKSADRIEIKEEKCFDKEDEIREKPRKIKTNQGVPKLKISIKNIESYQEEFMSKFKEFSESWRNQIIKNQQI
ncbi:hypothetical protein SteCoe_21003 [Stentor coeruleus]|uniref:Uncharacterized protein n=1 Tax=Stentor coeruleus TaxID=5963 RepID=A0A1R2BQK4_9CILI|nr:hypothetical protein SteCoe_21003 [Stentor coeruleus]